MMQISDRATQDFAIKILGKRHLWEGSIDFAAMLDAGKGYCIAINKSTNSIVSNSNTVSAIAAAKLFKVGNLLNTDSLECPGRRADAPWRISEIFLMSSNLE